LRKIPYSIEDKYTIKVLREQKLYGATKILRMFPNKNRRLSGVLETRGYSEYFTFQQDGAPSHRARETVELLKQATPDFIPPSLWPPNSPDLNPVDYMVWGSFKSVCKAHGSRTWKSFASVSRRNGTVWTRK